MSLRSFKGEALKLLYNRWILLTLLSTGIFIPTMCAVLNSTPIKINFDFAANQLFQSFYLGQVGFVVVTALYFGEELLKHSLRTSLLCTPCRLELLFAKLISVIALEVFCVCAFTAASFVVIQFKYKFSVNTDVMLRMIILLMPCYVSVIQLSIIEAVLTIISRSVIFSLAVIVSMLLGLGQLLLQFGNCFKYLLVLSVMNCFSTVPSPAYPSASMGIIIQLIWCTIFISIACLLLEKRDVR